MIYVNVKNLLNTWRTYAIKRLKVTPVLVRINPTRTSLKARASRVNLSYFSCTTGIKSINDDSNIPVTEMKIAKPERPAEKFIDSFSI